MNRFARVLCALLGLAICQARPSCASSYKVVPVQLSLSQANSRTLLTLKNESQETLRFQVTVAAWDQGSQDDMNLEPTEDIVLFPSVLSVAANEERTLRVASATHFDSVEKTYRILFEELPPLEDSESQRQSQVRILTRMSIPVFLEPARVVAASRVETTLERGVLSFHLRNIGNVHAVVREVRARGLGAAGETVFTHSFKGWYVLAGGSRIYRIEIPEEDCRRAKRIALEVETDRQTLVEFLDPESGACTSGGQSAMRVMRSR